MEKNSEIDQPSTEPFLEEDIISKPELENPGRRKFLKALGATAATSALGGVAFNDGERILGETLNNEKEEKALRVARERLRSEFGIEVDFSPLQPHEKEEQWLAGEPVEYLVEKRRVCEALLGAFAVYPPVIYKKEANISIVRVMDDLKLNESGKWEDIHGLAEVEGVLHLQHVKHDGVLPLPRKGILGQIGRKNIDKEEFIATFHHELFHDLDDIDEDDWVRETRGSLTGMSGALDLAYLYKEELEEALKKSAVSLEGANEIRKKDMGFAYDHGKENHWEDKATIAELLLCGDREFSARAKTDEMLTKKVNFLKKFFFQKSRGIMDEGYWETIRAGRGNSEMAARYHKERAAALALYPDEELRAYVEHGAGERLDDEALALWRVDMLMGVPD